MLSTKLLCASLIFCVCYNTLFAQTNFYNDSLNQGQFYYEQAKYDSVVILWVGYSNDTINLKKGIALCHLGERDSARELLKLGMSDEPSLKTYFFAGKLYGLLEDFPKSIELYHKVLDSIGENENTLKHAVFAGLGESYGLSGDMEKSFYYREKNVESTVRYFGRFHKKSALAYNNLSISYYYQREYLKAIEVIKESIAIYEQLGLTKEAYLSYRNLGVFNLFLNRLEESEYYLHKALELGLTIRDERHFRLRLTYYYLASTYYFREEPEKAIDYLTKSIKSNSSIENQGLFPAYDQISNFNTWIYGTWRLSQTYAYMGNYVKAFECISYFERIIKTKNYRKESMFRPTNYEGLIEVVYASALNIALIANDQEKSFYYLQKIKQSNTNHVIRIDRTVLLGENNEGIVAHESLLQEAYYGAEMEEKIVLRNQLDSLYNLYSPNLVKIQSELNYTPESIQEVLCKSCVLLDYVILDYEKERAPVSIKFDDWLDNLYALVITKHTWAVRKVKLSPSAKTSIVNHSNSSLTGEIESALDSFKVSSMYKHLISPFINANRPFPEKLTIVPSGRLFYIPFDILENEKGQKLGEITNLSYLYTTSQLFKKPKQEKFQFTSFAPNYTAVDSLKPRQFSLLRNLTRDGIYNLPGSQHESRSLARLLGGRFVETIKSKESFSEHLATNGIVHFAGHALNSIDDPLESHLILGTVSGKTEVLEIRDILNKEVEAELIVLSACQTGISSKKNHSSVINVSPSNYKGMQSIGNALMIGGANSVVSTLWKIPDETTPLIMKHFYQNLKNGLSKSGALKKAKEQYLHDQDDPVKRQPYYWAGFVLYGNDEPVSFHDEKSDYTWYLIGSVVVATLIFGFIGRHKFFGL